ncbi:hypothetical protein AVEN_103465-1 [Araneus ventricosus]|uniref:Uncharacterized protein n=1 Tax=Araneus ventricosus TaxID=182803 RepID=A0A4Y2MPX2_ARAVE|nr:hypothetical protein AVEN_103465-1 [Araneus ventricosus]
MMAAAFKIAFDERRNTESLETLLKRAQYRFLEMYRRPTVQRLAENTCDAAEDKEEGRMVIDESGSPVDSNESTAEFKIHCRSVPPAVIDWFDVKATYTFRCTKCCRNGEKITLYKITNTLDVHVEKRL